MAASKIIQYIHRPTLTELGWGNTHDRYLVVDSDKDLSNVFPLGVEINLLDTNSDKVYKVYSKVETNEFRLKRLGDIVDDYHMEPGDEIVITHYELSGNVLDMLTVNECGRILLNPGRRKNGKIEDFEIVNIKRLPGFQAQNPFSFPCEYNGVTNDINISFSESRKKRSDSPSETQFFSVKIGQQYLDYDPKNYYYLTVRNDVIVVKNLPKSDCRVLLESNEPEGKRDNDNEKVLQRIFYGAPGTGKSNTIKDITNKAEKEGRVFRTTFHPDSDYSTFVGCYKPKSIKASAQSIIDYDSLVDRFKKYISDLGNITHASAAIGYNYHDSIVKMQESGGHTIADLLADAHKSGTTYDTTIRSGMLLYEEQVQLGRLNSKITYEFVAQAFTNAYIKAWNTTEDVYLIIEEINRGNCAQIFGDLFQLLDRKNGESEYPVDADTDLANYLHIQLANTCRTDIPEEVKNGKKLKLPSNLYIWATMNTSDQSLFPIDSAFKRRWDWKYLKIKEGKDKNGNKLDWVIDVNLKDDNGEERPVKWWAFIKKINEIIASMTSSADKQLGYFFCKPDKKQNETDQDATIISEDAFVGKVLFYLWNDVFKDYGFEDATLFRFKSKEEDEEKESDKDLTFPDFYDEEGEKVNTVRVTDFVQKVMNWKKNNEENS